MPDNIAHRFAPGDKVLVLHPPLLGGVDVEPTPAIILRVEPYRHPRGGHVTRGYRVAYPDATEQWHCHEGWKPEAVLRGTEGSTRV